MKNQHASPGIYSISRYFQDISTTFIEIPRLNRLPPSPTCSFNGIGFAGADRGGGLASILQQQGE